MLTVPIVRHTCRFFSVSSNFSSLWTSLTYHGIQNLNGKSYGYKHMANIHCKQNGHGYTPLRIALINLST